MGIRLVSAGAAPATSSLTSEPMTLPTAQDTGGQGRSGRLADPEGLDLSFPGLLFRLLL